MTVLEKEAEMEELIGEGRFLRFRRRGAWEFVERTAGHGVALIAVDEGHLLLVEQYRPPVGRRVVDIPAGLVGDEGRTESLEEGARRELLEETGYLAGRMELLTEGPPSPGVCSEVVTFFRACDLEKLHEGGGEPGEQIAVHRVPLLEAREWLERRRREGTMLDPRVYVALYFAQSA
ncbi:MAG: NUDIX hydrolase [Armatimonadetes bacterium]|nr:NUDIX hydrolase [Armatimonadota bacterium]